MRLPDGRRLYIAPRDFRPKYHLEEASLVICIILNIDVSFHKRIITKDNGCQIIRVSSFNKCVL